MIAHFQICTLYLTVFSFLILFLALHASNTYAAHISHNLFACLNPACFYHSLCIMPSTYYPSATLLSSFSSISSFLLLLIRTVCLCLSYLPNTTTLYIILCFNPLIYLFHYLAPYIISTHSLLFCNTSFMT